jgi:hypothetical protein
MTDLITGGIFAAASLDVTPKWDDGRGRTGVANVCVFSLIFYKHIVD